MTTAGDSAIYTRRRFRAAFLRWLGNDSVRNLIWLYYFWFIAGSVHLAFFAYPIRLIIDPMGQMVYDAWAWMPLLAAPVALGGLALRHGGSTAADIRGPLLRQDFLGLWMQIGGHSCMTIVLAVFIGTGWYGRDPGQPVPSVFWLCAYLMGVAFLAAQCLYKVILGRRR